MKLLSLLYPFLQPHFQPTLPKRYHHSLQHLMDRRNLSQRRTLVAEEASGAGEAITIKDGEDLKIDPKRSMPYQIALLGY